MTGAWPQMCRCRPHLGMGAATQSNERNHWGPRSSLLSRLRGNRGLDGGGVQRLNLILTTCSRQLDVTTWTTAVTRIMKLRQGSLGKKYLV